MVLSSLREGIRHSIFRVRFFFVSVAVIVVPIVRPPRREHPPFFAGPVLFARRDLDCNWLVRTPRRRNSEASSNPAVPPLPLAMSVGYSTAMQLNLTPRLKGTAKF